MHVSQSSRQSLLNELGASGCGREILKKWFPEGQVSGNDFKTKEWLINIQTGYATSFKGSLTRTSYIDIGQMIYGCSFKTSFNFLLDYQDKFNRCNKMRICADPKLDCSGIFEGFDCETDQTLFWFNSDGYPWLATTTYLGAKGKQTRLWGHYIEDKGWDFNIKLCAPYPVTIKGDKQGAPIILVASPKEVNYLARLGFTAATWAGWDINKLSRVDWTPLKGRTVYIWPPHKARYYNLFDSILGTIFNPSEGFIVSTAETLPQDASGPSESQDILSSSYLIDQYIQNHSEPLQQVPVDSDQGQVHKQATIANKLSDWCVTLNQYGKPISNADNVFKILTNDPFLRGNIHFNELKSEIITTVNLTTGRKKKFPLSVPVEDFELYLLGYMQTKYSSGFRNVACKNGLALWTKQEKNIKNPLKELVESEEWDGKKRIENFFFDYSFFPHDPENKIYNGTYAGMYEYLQKVGRKIFCSLIHRLYEPGCYLDNIIIFISRVQGVGKSKLFDIMAKDYVLPFNRRISKVGVKTFFEVLKGKWIIEFPELDAFTGCTEGTKNILISTQQDSFRGAYKRDSSDNGRMCVLFGNTNELRFLDSTKGARRYIIVDMNPLRLRQNEDGFKFLKLSEDLKQLYAEALHEYHMWGDHKFYDMPPWEKFFHPKTKEERNHPAFCYLNRLRTETVMWTNEEIHYLERLDIHLSTVTVEEFWNRGDMKAIVDPNDKTRQINAFFNKIKKQLEIKEERVQKGITRPRGIKINNEFIEKWRMFYDNFDPE